MIGFVLDSVDGHHEWVCHSWGSLRMCLFELIYCLTGGMEYLVMKITLEGYARRPCVTQQWKEDPSLVWVLQQAVYRTLLSQ
jgi:hypothetical protein